MDYLTFICYIRNGGDGMNIIKKKDGFRDERHIILPNISESNLLNHPLINFTYLSEVGYYPSAKYHYRERTNGSNEFILIYCLEGHGTIELKNNQTITMGRGSIYCIPPHHFHRYYSDDKNPWSILWLHFHTNFEDSFHLNQSESIIVKSQTRNSMIQSHFIDLFEIAEKNTTTETFLVTSQLLRLILSDIYLLTDDTSTDQQNINLTKCMKYMNEHLHEELTLTDFAQHLDISTSYLSNLFKKYTNKAPIEFFIELRIEQACKYLKLSDLKVYEIAKKVGYTDPYYFSRIFKKITGYSPRTYRNEFSKDIRNLSVKK